MHRGLMLPCFVLAVFMLAALLAPPVYWGAQELSRMLPGSGFLQEVSQKPFSKYVSRLAMIFALAGLWPLLRWLRAGWREIGVTRPDWQKVGRGALLAFITLGAFILVAFWFGAREWRRATPDRVWLAVLGGLQAAVVVSVIEEFVFRGVIFGLLRRGEKWMAALVLSSALFAIVHFLHSPETGVALVEWNSGFAALGSMIVPADAQSTRLPQFVNLWLCGAILAWAYQRTGNLWFSIGLHGGWIFWLKFANSVTRTVPDAVTWWGTRKVIDGWGTTVLLAVTAIFCGWLTRGKRTLTDGTTNSQSTTRVG
jgi:uncharacterized protein